MIYVLVTAVLIFIMIAPAVVVAVLMNHGSDRNSGRRRY